jgi:hypothetical protein
MVEIPRISQIIRHTCTDQSAVVMAEIGRAVPRSCAEVAGAARTLARATNEMNRCRALISILPLIEAGQPSADRVAAIHHERVPDHQGCGVAAKPKDGACDLLGATKPADRHVFQHRVKSVCLSGHHSIEHRRMDYARTDGVYSNGSRCVVQCRAFCQSKHTVGSVASGLGLRVRSLQTGYIAVAGSASCTEPDACSPAVTAIGWPTQAGRSPLISAGLGNRKRSNGGWAATQTCWRSSPISRRACTGVLTSVGVASMTQQKSDRTLA